MAWAFWSEVTAVRASCSSCASRAFFAQIAGVGDTSGMLEPYGGGVNLSHRFSVLVRTCTGKKDGERLAITVRNSFSVLWMHYCASRTPGQAVRFEAQSPAALARSGSSSVGIMPFIRFV